MERIFSLGYEKIVLNTAAAKKRDLVRDAVRRFGSQSVVGSVDVKSGAFSANTRSASVTGRRGLGARLWIMFDSWSRMASVRYF